MLKTRLVLILIALVTLALFAGPAMASGSAPESLPSFRVTSIHQWIVDRMTTWSPPGITYVKDAKETPEEGKGRYEDIADSIIAVTYDRSESPIFQGARGRAMTAALLTSIAFHESAFRKDVDTGTGPLARGDSGRSWCMAQVQLGLPDPKSGNTRLRVVMGREGLRFIMNSSDPDYGTAWGGRDLVQDRMKCFRVALRLARMSFASCKSLPVQDRLSMYTSGSCGAGVEASRNRVGFAMRWLWKSAPPLVDSQVLDLLYSTPSESPKEKGASLFFGPSVGIVPS